MIQDMDDERHVLLRPVESMSHEIFFNMMQITMNNYELWDVNLEQHVATRVHNV